MDGPVFAETGPDGNLWVADWYNPVIQHNPDKRGMDNQIWNADKGEGNAHINKLAGLWTWQDLYHQIRR